MKEPHPIADLINKQPKDLNLHEQFSNRDPLTTFG